jgi:hypothetical protein
MQELTQILRDATAAIEQRFMRLPIHGSTPIYRERVYCYELYHQLRSRWPAASPFTLNGEVDKRGHEVLAALEADNTIPDLLVHVPGDMAGNHAIIEVKPQRSEYDGVLKDLETLSAFRSRVGYERAIYLFYGGIPNVRLKRAIAEIDFLPPVELWVHQTAGSPAEYVTTLQK